MTDPARIMGASAGAPLVRDLPIINKRGLHARASARFVQCVEKFDAHVTVARDQTVVDGLSIMGLMMLGAGPGTTVRVSVEGADAEAALAAIAALVASRFGEEE